jgi:ribonuclease HI
MLRPPTVSVPACLRGLVERLFEVHRAIDRSELKHKDLESLKQPARSKPPVPRARWEKPDQGWVKVNSDASYDQDMCSSSAGAVIRDHAGIVKGGVARWFDDVGDVLTGEALAAKEGLELAAELGFDRVILEVDCQELSKLLQSPYSCTSSIGGLCFDIIELGKSFSEFSVRWVRREANSVAHFCASIVSATDRCSFWFDCIPDWLEDLAISDCTLASN